MADWNKKLGFSSELPASEAESSLPFQEVSLETKEIVSAARANLDFFAALTIPTIFRYLFPPLFHSIWALLIDLANKLRDFTAIAIGIPRGFGKTMLVKLFILYCIIFTHKRFILVVCGTQLKANNIISDIQGMLDESNILKVFGNWRLGSITDRLDLKRFGFRGRNIILMGAGAGSDIRGMTLENERPDIIVFDDIQSKEDSESETVSMALEKWLYGTAMKAKSPHGCLFIFIANMYPSKWSLLRRIKQNPSWTKFIVGGILASGESLWEELQPLTQLHAEYERDFAAGYPEIFFSEVLNDDNLLVNRAIDTAKIPYNPYQGEELYQGSFIIIDPANDKVNSDYVAVIYCEVFDGAVVVAECYEERLSPSSTIDLAISIALRRNCRLIAVESNAYQYSLLHWFSVITEQRGIVGLNCVDVYSGRVSKNSRILSTFKELVPTTMNPAPTIFLSLRCRAQIITRIVQFNPLKTNNVDNLLDCLTYIPTVISSYSEFIMSALTFDLMESSPSTVLTEAENCTF